MENNNENKAKFFAQYWGQKILVTTKQPELRWINNHCNKLSERDCLELKPLSSITDEDAIEVARIVYERPAAKFDIDRREDIMHLTNVDNVQIRRHVCINYKYATLNCNVTIPDSENKPQHFKHNIGEIDLSARNVIAYIRVIDFLRGKGYAAPFSDLSVEELVNRGWIKLKH